jgi:UDP-N-acetylmuramoylalanine--D-glutamate ligase
MRDIKSIDKYNKIGVMGIARSGLAVGKKLRSMGKTIFLSDSKSRDSYPNISEIESIGRCEFSGHTAELLEMDLLIVSPGIRLDLPLLVSAKEQGIPLWSEIELGYRLTHPDTPIIAVTGSNGKSTTVSLIHHILQRLGFYGILAGNIGDAFTGYEIENNYDYIVLEVSSFQLDLIESFCPDVACILNITPDHLDRYDDFEHYARSKYRIAKNQNSDQHFILNLDTKNLGLEFNSQPRLHVFQNYSEATYRTWVNKLGQNIEFDSLALKGPHNRTNILVALLCVELLFELKYQKQEANLKLPISNKINYILKSFSPLSYRMESVAQINGVEYINDSKATNTDSVIVALRSFPQPIHLILGGSDKGEDFSVLIDEMKGRVRKLYLIGETSEKMSNDFKNCYDIEIFADFESVIRATYSNAVSGEVVLLSPACASFDWFRNYEHRGDEFKRIVCELLGTN